MRIVSVRCYVGVGVGRVIIHDALSIVNMLILFKFYFVNSFFKWYFLRFIINVTYVNIILGLLTTSNYYILETFYAIILLVSTITRYVITYFQKLLQSTFE